MNNNEFNGTIDNAYKGPFDFNEADILYVPDKDDCLGFAVGDGVIFKEFRFDNGRLRKCVVYGDRSAAGKKETLRN